MEDRETIETPGEAAVWRPGNLAGLYGLALAGVYAGSNALSPSLSTAAAALGVPHARRDIEVAGPVSLALWLTAAAAALIAGTLVARGPGWRRCDQALSALLFLSCAATAATCAVHKLEQLLVLRALTGVALGSSLPLAYSALAAAAPPSGRSLLVAYLTVNAAAGTLGGQVLSGLLAARTNWKLPFLVIGAFGVALSPLPLLAGRHAGAQAAAVAAEHVDSLGQLSRLLRVPSNVLILAATLPGCLPWGVMGAYAIDYLAVDDGLGLRAASIALLFFAAGGLAGGLGLNAAVAALRRRSERAALRLLGPVAGCTLSLAIAPLSVIINGAHGQAKGRLFFCCFAAGVLSFNSIPAVRLVLLNVNPPAQRGAAVGCYALLEYIGRGIGPYLVSRLTQRVGRRRAFIDALLLWVWSATLFIALGLTLPGDEARAREEEEEAGAADEAGAEKGGKGEGCADDVAL